MNTKFVKSVLISCVMLLLVGCTVRKTAEPPAMDKDIRKAFKEVLLHGAAFETHEGESTLSEVYRMGTELEMAEENRTYAEADLDRDGIPEIVLTLAMADSEYPVGYEVLHYDGEQINGYYVNYRGLMSLKTDGTFRQSGGAYDWSVDSLVSFEAQGFTTSHLMWCESAPMEDGQVRVRYFAEGSELTEAEFYDAVDKWQTREDVVFYPLSEFK